MSASVRRLESERAALKDELGRLTAQRDEARQQIVVLMQEAEEKKAGDQRIKELEEALEELDQRYQTTLEMLGEKSEQVEEQKADIEDLKKIYRELVESMVK
jgi:chromosome segregation ATPase